MISQLFSVDQHNYRFSGLAPPAAAYDATNECYKSIKHHANIT